MIHVPTETEALAGIGINVTEIGIYVDKTVYKQFKMANIPDPI
jgi:hypothetical protein